MGDRRHKTYRFIVEDSDQSHDAHDFCDGYKAIPLAIGLAVPEDPPATKLDKHGNRRIVLPADWRLAFSIRFNRLAGVDLKGTYSQHVDDLNYVVESILGGACAADWFLESDSGSDSNYHTLRAQLYLSDFFRQRQMGVLALGGSCPGNSPSNRIERLISEPKKAINTLQIPDVVGNDTVSPAHQSDLTQAHRIIKETQIYDITGKSLKCIWEKLKVGGEPIKVRYILPTVCSLPVPLLFCGTFNELSI
jgi:hypothetical protein